jgi:hypothetical protein
MALKTKRSGVGLEVKTIPSKKDKKKTYLVYRTPKGAFHVFVEVQAKAAAYDCGLTEDLGTRAMWEQIWDEN